MITKLNIKNYKCIQEGEFSLAPLTVLCGVNSGGKSSFLQALLLGAEAWHTQRQEGLLDLMRLSFGLKLFSYEEILNVNAIEESITIGIHENGQEMEVQFLLLKEESNEIRYKMLSLPKEKKSRKIWYLGADRSITQYQIRGNRQNLSLGDNYEYLAFILELGREAKLSVDKRKNRVDESNIFLSTQVNEWLDFLMPGSYVSGESYGKDNMVSLLFDKTKYYHKSNVGFGVSFTLPVLVAGLLAKEGDVLIVENPELHLHPKAQSNIMYFFERLARCGVQVLLETHSDHIVNGLQKIIVDSQCGLKANDVLIYFFDKNAKGQEIHLDQNAELNHWPDEFMDQEDKDLYFIRKHRKQGR